MGSLAIIAFCIVLNAGLAAMEIAFVTVNRSLVREHSKNGSYRAKKLLKLKEYPERTLSTIQIGITLLAALSAAVGGSTAELTLVPYLQLSYNLPLWAAELIALVFVVIPLTYVTVVVGEITPKALALRKPYAVATLGAPLLRLLSKGLYPLVRVCEVSTQKILESIPYFREESAAKEEREYEKVMNSYLNLPPRGQEYMKKLGNLKDKTLEEIYLPWKKTDTVSHHLDLESLKKSVIATGHTRMPVVDGESIEGVINTKEILALSPDIDWRKFIHEPMRFEKGASPLYALNALQEKRVHLGIVMDQNEVLGIVTMEDILEEVLGEIYDEDDFPRR